MYYDDNLKHYGTPRHSGRYPWGSGEDPYQHRDNASIYRQNKALIEKVNKLRREGLSDSEIAVQVGSKNSTDLRARISAARNNNRKMDIEQAKKLLERGYSQSEVARRVEIPESTLRGLLSEKTMANANKSSEIANQLKEALKTKKYLNVGIGVESMLGENGISRDRLDKVLNELQNEGYAVEKIKVSQATNPDQYTTMRVLAPPGTTMRDISRNRTQIENITPSIHADSSVKAFGIEKPTSVSSDRIFFTYADDDPSGKQLKDGIIELRRGVPDLYLGDNKAYAQVRIAVDDKYYCKGMAMYSDNIPPGYDIVVNSNKDRGAPLNKVLKVLKKVDEKDPDSPVDWDNPFGAVIKDPKDGGQYHYKDPKTGEDRLSPLNKVNDQGDWDKWKKEVSAQFLSKQPLKLIKRQLELSYEQKKEELAEIEKVQNPVVRSYLLQEFGRTCDSEAVYLHAAGFPRQGQKVILPLNSLKPGEVYAPSYRDGEMVMLVRHPHEGTFQIPVLKVNNRNKDGINLLGNVQDAIGIRQEAAEQLSGADFDGDTVTVIPIKGIEKDINTQPAYKELLAYDHQREYAKTPDMEKTGKEKKNRFVKKTEMGKISNLITDMTLQDAPKEDVIRAVKYSMCVIDAEKHNLDWKRCFEEQNIPDLRKRYQGKVNGGASTLISKARGMEYVDQRALDIKIAPDGSIIPRYTGKTVIGKDGKEHVKRQKSSHMAERDDARTLMSNPNGGFPQEELYAEYANRLKALGNTSRKESLGLKGSYNESAAKVYEREVSSLISKLNRAIKNKPYETLAQIEANEVSRGKIRGLDPDLDSSERTKAVKKIKQQALTAARKKVGSSKDYIEFTEKEWEALMAGAFRPTTVSNILKNTKSSTIKAMAMPRESKDITSGMRRLIMTMNNSSYSLADIAERVNLSTSTVDSIIRGLQ